LDLLDAHFGANTAAVAHCERRADNEHYREDASLSAFVAEWKEARASNRDFAHYFKDWHFVQQQPDTQLYCTPLFFQDDWLNEYYDHLNACHQAGKGKEPDDYRFVYLGPATSYTPLHCDVLRSFSWSVNVCGRKRWTLYHPDDVDLLTEHGRKHASMPFLSVDGLADPQRYPHFAEARPLHVVQSSGEALFVPSGWAHQVYNETDCLSINHNWLNACNVHYVWQFLCNDLRLVEDEIADCRAAEDWPEQCQVLLRLNSGLDLLQFSELLLVALRARLPLLADADRPLELRYGALFATIQCLEIAKSLLCESYMIGLHQSGRLDAFMSASQIGRQLVEHFRNDHALSPVPLPLSLSKHTALPLWRAEDAAGDSTPAGTPARSAENRHKVTSSMMWEASSPTTILSATSSSSVSCVPIDVSKPWPPQTDALNVRHIEERVRRRRGHRPARRKRGDPRED